MNRFLYGRPLTVRITAGFLCAMAVLFLGTAAFIYGRMNFALNRSINDVPKGNQAELEARQEHRDEALHELLGQLAVAFAGTLAISGFVGYRVARAALDPVERMRKRASTGAVDSGFRLPVPDTDDELARLAETLNELLARVQSGVEREQQLVADASHELRTPLSQLVLRIDLALSRERTNEDLRRSLESLKSDANRLVELANGLLLIARADEGHLRLELAPVPIASLFARAAARFDERSRSVGRTIEIKPPGDLTAVADRVRLEQAVDNLVENSLQHGQGTIALAAEPNGAMISLDVTDAGPGFPDGFAERAFDRFATASPGRSGSGNGLGLAIVAAIVKAHGGEVVAGNDPAGGARVSIRIPTQPYTGALPAATALPTTVPQT